MPKYIDAEALKAVMVFSQKTGNLTVPEMRDILSLIDSVPAENVEPKRKSGRWIIAGAFDDFYQCPECGEMWPIFSTIEWKCCPICECKIITNRPKGEGECLSE